MRTENPADLLAQANMSADIIAKAEGIKEVTEKARIMAMIIQNLHEALLAYDQKADITGKPMNSAQIGAGLKQMLNYLLDRGLWAKLRQNASAELTNNIIKLTGLIRASANSLLDENL